LVSSSFDQWAILELMGHVRVAGRVTEEERFGCRMGRIDIPTADGGFVTQWFGGSSVYRLTPTTEEIARTVATNCNPAPVGTWELTRVLPAPPVTDPIDFKHEEEDADDDFDDDRDFGA
jgi:hypothetical protein